MNGGSPSLLGFRTGLGRRSGFDILGAMPSSPMPIAPAPLGTGFVVVARMLLLPRLRDVDGVYLDRFCFFGHCFVLLLMSLKAVSAGRVPSWLFRSGSRDETGADVC